MVLTASGCASVVGSTSQTLRIETKTVDGSEVIGADCELINELGKFRMTSPGFVNVLRSSSDLKINCVRGAQAAANAIAVSRANAGMYGNIVVGGVIGATIDHARGAGYSYPEWIQLIFGRYLVVDAKHDQPGQPSVGYESSVK